MADVSYYLSLPYTQILKRDDDGDIVATIAELDGCMAHGADSVEALENLREVQTLWIEAALAAHKDIPLPEADNDLPSGKFVVRLPRFLHLKLNKLAKSDEISLNQLMVVAVTEHLTRREVRVEASRHISNDQWAWQPNSGWNIQPRIKETDRRYLKLVTERGRLSTEDQKDTHVERHLIAAARR